VKATRVLVVDDHALFRKGVASLLRDAEGFVVVGEARDGREALAKAEALTPDAVIMDIYMPGMDGIEAARRIRQAVPSVRIVMLTVSEEDENLFEALKGGILTTGALVIGEYLSGPRKGRAKWGREQKCRVLVSDAEVAAAEAREKERKSAGEPT